MADDVIVVRTAASVNEKQAVAMTEPVLLRVVAAKIFSVVKGPGFDGGKVQAIVAGRNVGLQIVSKCQKIAALKCGQRRFKQSAFNIQFLECSPGF